MQQDQRQLIKKYLDIFLRQKKIIITGLLIGVTVGLWQYSKTPKMYRSAALIKYQRQQISSVRKAPGDINARPEDAIETIKQEVVSRTNLQEIIRQFDLYPNLLHNRPMEDVVEQMRKFIAIGQGRGGDIFQVSFDGSDPKKTMMVTNAIAAKIIEENLRFRQERALETSVYVDDELRMAKEALDKKDQVMRDYKLKYYNQLPDQRNSNMARLSAMQQQYQESQKSISELERTKLMVQEQIALREEAILQLSSSDPDVFMESQTGNVLGQIKQLQGELVSLQLRYTEKHPQVRKLKKRIDQLKKSQLIMGSPNGDGSEEVVRDDAGIQTWQDQRLNELKRQHKDLDYNISQLRNGQERRRELTEQYQAWIEAVPVREAEWSALTRDYSQLRNHYDSLLSASIEAESTQKLEERQKGSQFKIVESAYLPGRPVEPDFQKIMLLAMGVGLGLGCCLGLGREMLGTSFKHPEDIEDFLELPVICAIPLVPIRREKIKARIVTILWSLVLLVSVCGVGAIFVYMWKKGMIIL